MTGGEGNYGNTAMEIVWRDILEVTEIVGLDDKSGMVSEERKEPRMVYSGWMDNGAIH